MTKSDVKLTIFLSICVFTTFTSAVDGASNTALFEEEKHQDQFRYDVQHTREELDKRKGSNQIT